jgi:hypothetical protein
MVTCQELATDGRKDSVRGERDGGGNGDDNDDDDLP